MFDGHGGKEVSIFVRHHFVNELVKSQMYLKKNYESALKETFHRMDEMLLTPAGVKELFAIAEKYKSREGDDTTNLS